MYQVLKDSINGTIQVSDSWIIGATGVSAAPSFTSPNQQIGYTIHQLYGVETFKSFTYSASGISPDRYLYVEYRVSRDYQKWTPYQPLLEYITNFPPFTSTDEMYLDIRFTRQGASTIGDIKLLSYQLNGMVTRNVVDGQSATIALSSTNLSVVVKPPFIYKVFSITDIEIISKGKIDKVNIKYRYSQDYGRTVTQWEPFTKENITTAKITPIRFFQIEYLLELTDPNETVKIYDINLIGDFQNVTKDYFKTNLYGVRENCNCLKLNLVNDPTSNMSTEVGGQPGMLTGDLNQSQDVNILPQLSDDEKNNLFKPYQLTAATDLLNKMSNDASSIFGHEVVYFLTDPDKKGIDYTFHEYQLYNYICDELIKVSVENNQFPDNTGAINQFDLSLFESFEIHITKEVFKKAFGPDKRPSKEDFLWFCEINRMFTVEHAQPYRGFNNNAIYYKIMLKKYNQKANVIAGSQTLQDRVKQLTKNSTIDELFGLENNQDKQAVANKQQFEPLTRDTLRLELNAQINKELLENAELVISKSNYDLFSVGVGQDAVVYRNMKNNWLVSDNIGYMCWFNINNYVINDTYSFFDYYDMSNSLGFKMTLQADNITVTLNQDNYDFPLEFAGGVDYLNESTWYCYVVNIDQRQRKLSQWIYKRNVDDESEASYLNDTKLRLMYQNQQDISPVNFNLEDSINAKIIGSDMKITNIRLFDDVITENTHNKILNQTIIREDAKYLIFADNANTRLILPNYPTSQISPGSVGY